MPEETTSRVGASQDTRPGSPLPCSAMKKLLTLVLLVPSFVACDDKATSTAAPSPSGAALTAASAAPAKTATCDEVVANIEKVSGSKADPDGLTLIKGMCNDATPAVRTCMATATTKSALDACDPHPLAKEMAKEGAKGAKLSSADFVEHDLSTADPAWKGWTAKGPKDAKVMADGVKGARIAANGMDAFDISFTSTKEKLADLKKGAETAAKTTSGKAEFSTDTADKLVWNIDNSGIKRFFFAQNMKVGGKDVGCGTGPMGVAKLEDLKVYEESCASLAKK